MADQSDVNGLVRAFRRRAGLTQQELADLAGLSVATLRDIEQDRVASPRAGTMRQLAEALTLSRTELGELAEAASRAMGSSAARRSGVRIDVLGPLRVIVDGSPADVGAGQRALLGLLALTPNQPVDRGALIEALWGSLPPANAVGLLHTRMSRLRTRLGPPSPTRVSRPARSSNASATGDGGLVTTTATGYQLVVAEDQLDLLVFRALLVRARSYRDGDEPALACAAFADAARLWRGQPLAGLEPLENHVRREALTREYRAAIVDYATVAAHLGRHDEVVPRLQQLAEADPLNEAVHAALITAEAGRGHRAAAVAIYDQLRGRLADELGVDPGPELAMAYERIGRPIPGHHLAPVSVHHQLPPDIDDFTGRADELAQLHRSLPLSSDGHTAVAITAIEGMGGVGKTRLAVRLAHQLVQAGRYADHQLYVDLHGHADFPPADPASVLASFLRLLGVPGDQIPPDVQDRAALYRDRMYGMNVLVLLDNAADQTQIAPLLPASPSNLVLITSRRALALDGAQTLTLDVFDSADARALLTNIFGPDRVNAEPESAQRVIELCGRLPLAIALAARRLQTRPTWQFADLADRLQETANRLGQLALGTRQLHPVFELSYRNLTAEQQRVFRLLRLQPGADFTAHSVAALLGADPGHTLALLDGLVDEHLLTMSAADRYRQHDLIRDFAQQVAHTEESEHEWRSATERVLDYYVHTAHQAARVEQPRRWITAPVCTPPSHQPEFSTSNEALAWLEAERSCIAAAVHMAATYGWQAHAWQLAESMQMFLQRHGYMDDLRQIQEVGLKAAIIDGNMTGEAAIRIALGTAYVYEKRSDEAWVQVNDALLLCRELGNKALETYGVTVLGVLARQRDQFADALSYSQQALSVLGDTNEYPAGVLHNNIGLLLTRLGRVDEALEHLARGVTLSQLAGSRDDESTALTRMGDSYRLLGRYDEAIDSLSSALRVAMAAGNEPRVAYARNGLGNTYRDMGRTREALVELEAAWRIARTARGSLTECEALIDLAMAECDAGHSDAARDHATVGLELAVEEDARYQQMRALSAQARIHRHIGPDLTADDCLRRAQEIAAELGIPQP